MISARKIIKGLIFAIPIAMGVFWLLGNERVLQISLNDHTGPSQKSALLFSSSRDKFEIPQALSLTNKIADQIAKEIIAKNPDGPTSEGGELSVNINPGEALKKIIEATRMPQMAPEEFDISLEELSVIYSDDIESKKTYFTELQRIIKETLGIENTPTILVDAIIKLVTENNDAGLREILGRHEAAILALKKLQVPAALVPLHKSEITLLAKTKTMIEGMLSYSSDPMRAYLAFQIYPKLQEEAVSLQKEFVAYVTKEKIIF